MKRKISNDFSFDIDREPSCSKLIDITKENIYEKIVKEIYEISYFPEEVISGMNKSFFNNKLDLSNMELGSKDIIKYVIPFLDLCKDITSLDVSSNGIGVKGLKAIAKNRTIKFLNVGSNPFIWTDLKRIKKELIDKGTTMILPPKDHSIIRELSENPILEVLYIHEIECEDEAALAFVNNKTLKVLNMRGNFLTSKGAITLSKNSSINKLDLMENDIRGEGIKALTENDTIRELSIGVDFCKNESLINDLFNSKLNTLRIQYMINVVPPCFDLRSFYSDCDSHRFPYPVPLSNGLNVLYERIEKFRNLISERWVDNQKQKNAFLMGYHPRLGKGSPILPFFEKCEKNVIKLIFSYAIKYPLKLLSKKPLNFNKE